MNVTESQLATALEGFYVTVESGGGDGRGNLLTARGPVADADETAEALFATLGRMAALRESHPDFMRAGPWADDRDVVDAHICCEHAGTDDQELSAMADIVRLMSSAVIDPYAVVRALYPLDGLELHRALRWFTARYPGPPPF